MGKCWKEEDEDKQERTRRPHPSPLSSSSAGSSCSSSSYHNTNALAEQYNQRWQHQQQKKREQTTNQKGRSLQSLSSRTAISTSHPRREEHEEYVCYGTASPFNSLFWVPLSPVQPQAQHRRRRSSSE